ncbi:MAG: GxxExxY protein [Leptospira sp.]|nr:GxxExxY protein [Leptospira sp.]
MLNNSEISKTIISAAFSVSNTLGCGFLEKVYQNAMIIELRDNGLLVESQRKFQVIYKGHPVGDYVSDILVERMFIVELKSIRKIENIHRGQLLNYLKAANLRFGLVINFGNPKIEIARVANG